MAAVASVICCDLRNEDRHGVVAIAVVVCVPRCAGLSASADKVSAVDREEQVTPPAALSPVWRRGVSDLSVTSPSFADILRDELLQTATIEHTANKSLALIQVRRWRCGDNIDNTAEENSASSAQSEYAGCRQQGHAGSKTLHQQNTPVLN